jgi:arylsulfatase A-like enzyme
VAGVVLILVDQLRHDAAERWMPETRALAERGVRFEQMRSAAPWTYPSVISLFSGLYPHQHGADTDGGSRLTTISSAVPLLPRTLRQAGYYTAAFITNPFLHEWNEPVRESFEHFDPSFIGNQGPTRGHPGAVWTKRMYSDSVNSAIRAHFDAHPRSAPEFVYVHYIDVHGRKEGPERWLDAPFEPSYEAATRYVDGKIVELYEYFMERYSGRLLFAVTSDHGQDLDDDVLVGDGPIWRVRKDSLYEFNLRIPLFFLPSAIVQAPRAISQPCSNVDVAPTLLEWLGLPAQGAGPGTSLLGAIEGAPYDGASRMLYARNSANAKRDECIVHAGLKFMRHRRPHDGPVRRRRLYDLERDPREMHDLEQDSTAMEALLDEAADPRGVVFEARLEELDTATLQRLAELGYGGGKDE